MRTPHLIRNIKDWKALQNMNEGRMAGQPANHLLSKPDSYPCIVFTRLQSTVKGMDCEYDAIYLSDAKKLLSLANQK